MEHGLLMENLLDLAHAPFTHTGTFAKGWPVPDAVRFHTQRLLAGAPTLLELIQRKDMLAHHQYTLHQMYHQMYLPPRFRAFTPLRLVCSAACVAQLPLPACCHARGSAWSKPRVCVAFPLERTEPVEMPRLRCKAHTRTAMATWSTAEIMPRQCPLP